MAPLTDPIRLQAYKDALSNWNVKGYVSFELTEESKRWVKRELNNISLRKIKQLIFEAVESGVEIDEVQETRPEWDDHEYHYDLRFSIQGKSVYIETRLHFREPLLPDESSIIVVNIHEQ